MELNLAVIGLNHRTAPVEVRERYWIGESRRYEALHRLAQAGGISEVVILATCNRAEFILATTNFSEAANSVLEFLTAEYGLRPSDWTNFYRLEGREALLHVFRVTSGLDSLALGEPEITGQVKSAWAKAQQAGTAGRFLDTVFQKALSVAKRVRNETAISAAAISVPYAAVELAREIFGSLEGHKVLILGAGKMGELSARYLVNKGASPVLVANRTYEHALSLAEKLSGIAVPFEERFKHLAEADIVISSTGCPHIIFDREDARRIEQQRGGRPLFLIDIAVPRDVDPAVRDVPGVFLYDIDDLEDVVERNLSERRAAAGQAENIVAAEAESFVKKLAAQRVVPTIVAFRDRLEEIRRQEMERYRREASPVAPLEEEALEALTTRLVHRIATLLGRELKEIPERPLQEQMTAAVRRLFQLQPLEQAPPRRGRSEIGSV